ncbi:hypothetical protein H5410_049677 [Solanum commersonii]|uniref:Uncharacterized protein n=1 Tax=Solanum commersonii TaxID=4109 RepID=A0A9J5WTI9_SOLCO|nr:hypothetical protein H5410_049677 [Solanum commersonii]
MLRMMLPRWKRGRQDYTPSVPFYVAPFPYVGNECDGGKFSLSDISITKDTVNIGSSELSQQNRSSSNENQPENGGFSTTLEHKSTSEANANEDVSNDIPETAKENAEGASNCLVRLLV